MHLIFNNIESFELRYCRIHSILQSFKIVLVLEKRCAFFVEVPTGAIAAMPVTARTDRERKLLRHCQRKGAGFGRGLTVEGFYAVEAAGQQPFYFLTEQGILNIY